MPRCPIVFCRGDHPLKTDKSGSPFMFCDLSRSNFWFRSPDAQAWLNGNGGAAPSPPLRGGIRSRENPENVIESYGPAVEDGDEAAGEWPEARSNPAPMSELDAQIEESRNLTKKIDAYREARLAKEREREYEQEGQ